MKKIKMLIYGLVSLLALGGCSNGVNAIPLDTYSSKIETVEDLGLVTGVLAKPSTKDV